MKRIQANQLQIGIPVPFSVYDEDRNLLLREGLVLHNDRQLRVLMERGLYIDDSAAPGAAGGRADARQVEVTRSTLDQLARIRRELNAIVSENPISADGFEARVLGLATRLQNACQKDPDACLAGLFLDRSSRYSVRHLVHVAAVAQIVAEGAGQDESTCLSVVAAALTMNLSMLSMQDALQSMQRDELTPIQRQAIAEHPARSASLLRQLGVADEDWIRLVETHHESIDGSGYPKRLAGADVPVGAQIINLADGYTARLERRPDRDAKLPNLSMREIFLSRGKGVDPLLAAVLVKRIGIFPPGLVVELGNGEIAVVTKRSDNANAPEVHSILSADRMLHTRPVRRATDKPPFNIVNPVPLESVRVRINPLQFWM